MPQAGLGICYGLRDFSTARPLQAQSQADYAKPRSCDASRAVHHESVFEHRLQGLLLYALTRTGGCLKSSPPPHRRPSAASSCCVSVVAHYWGG